MNGIHSSYDKAANQYIPYLNAGKLHLLGNYKLNSMRILIH